MNSVAFYTDPIIDAPCVFWNISTETYLDENVTIAREPVVNTDTLI
jgi:hypothetical protein